LGSTLALTDEAGTVTDQFAYSPYGQLLSRTGTTATPFQWLGGYGVYYDSVSDLHLTLHRAYSAEQRRFIGIDPLGIDGFANLYAYGDLNPLAFVDPYGLCAESGSSYEVPVLSNYTPGYSTPRPTISSYQNSPQYLQNVDLNFGMSANPVTAEMNGKMFGAIGAGALGAVIAPAAVSTYGAASGFALDTSIKVSAAGGAALSAAYQTGANLYSQGVVELYKASANPTVNFLIQDVSSGTPGAVDTGVQAINWMRDHLQ
jgi:RHS repeat-associated protein